LAKNESTPPIQGKWIRYIERHAGKYACGMFSPEDAEQVAVEAYIKAQKRYVPAKGVFDNYARASIRNALLKARIAEQRHWQHRDLPEDDAAIGEGPASSAGEEAVIDLMVEAETVRSVSRWANDLPPNLAALWQGLYARDMSQREFAAEAGVTQACISQRNGKLIAHARAALTGIGR
jgi:RNA polymerase sigma factor (sigma-70 family)